MEITLVAVCRMPAGFVCTVHFTNGLVPVHTPAEPTLKINSTSARGDGIPVCLTKTHVFGFPPPCLPHQDPYWERFSGLDYAGGQSRFYLLVFESVNLKSYSLILFLAWQPQADFETLQHYSICTAFSFFGRVPEPLLLTTLQWVRKTCSYPYFSAGETKAQSGKATCPRSHTVSLWQR